MDNVNIALMLKGIKDSEAFFELVDRCKAPVKIQVPGGDLHDLRGNVLLQNYLTWESPISAIECVEVFCHTGADLASILEFIEEYQLF